MTHAQPDSANFIGSVPEYYEEFLGPFIFTPYAQDLSLRLQIGSRARILELACGTGRLTRELLAVMEPGARLVATDLNQPMLEVARRTAPDPRVEWRDADAANLPFDAASFDQAVCQFGVQFFADKIAAAAEVRRVLRPGAAYHLSTWGSPYDNPLARIAQETTEACFATDPPRFYWTPWAYSDRRQIESDLRAGGFRDVSIQSVDFVGRAPSADHAAMGLVQGTPMALAIEERGSMSVDAFTAVFAAALTRELGSGPLAIPMRAWIARAA
jgi:SAM-dependent methyltransferase